MANLKKLLLIGGSTAAVVLAGLTGCQTRDTSDRTAGRIIDDKAITERVEDRLKEDPLYKFTGVDVRTFAGVVQLSGFVDTQEQKNRAGELAQNVQGVTRVINNIALKPDTGLTPTG
ncbi:MAG TPA: BON domain-containing protein, partial [Verrucomicrobiota bacterium]|nr:BON domain-containing protein [Verrucomicrobiota bacterium]